MTGISVPIPPQSLWLGEGQSHPLLSIPLSCVGSSQEYAVLRPLPPGSLEPVPRLCPTPTSLRDLRMAWVQRWRGRARQSLAILRDMSPGTTSQAGKALWLLTWSLPGFRAACLPPAGGPPSPPPVLHAALSHHALFPGSQLRSSVVAASFCCGVGRAAGGHAHGCADADKLCPLGLCVEGTHTFRSLSLAWGWQLQGDDLLTASPGGPFFGASSSCEET